MASSLSACERWNCVVTCEGSTSWVRDMPIVGLYEIKWPNFTCCLSVIRNIYIIIQSTIRWHFVPLADTATLVLCFWIILFPPEKNKTLVLLPLCPLGARRCVCFCSSEEQNTSIQWSQRLITWMPFKHTIWEPPKPRSQSTLWKLLRLL